MQSASCSGVHATLYILRTLKNDIRATRICQHPKGLGFHRTTMEILFIDNNPQQANSIFNLLLKIKKGSKSNLFLISTPITEMCE